MGKRNELTPNEQAFCLYYFETRKPSLSCIKAGYPAESARAHADLILRRPKVKAYLRKLWEAAESPVVMGVRERKELLSEIARGMVGATINGEGKIDWEAVRGMPSVKEVTVEERDIGEVTTRTIRVKLLNPVESIHELNLMEKLYRTNEIPLYQDNRSVNYYITGVEVEEKLGRIGERTQKAIEQTGQKAKEGAVEEGQSD